MSTRDKAGEFPVPLCTDYRGEFLLGNSKYNYPLAVTDQTGSPSTNT
jgi:hypothetical protein